MSSFNTIKNFVQRCFKKSVRGFFMIDLCIALSGAAILFTVGFWFFNRSTNIKDAQTLAMVLEIIDMENVDFDDGGQAQSHIMSTLPSHLKNNLDAQYDNGLLTVYPRHPEHFLKTLKSSQTYRVKREGDAIVVNFKKRVKTAQKRNNERKKIKKYRSYHFHEDD